MNFLKVCLIISFFWSCGHTDPVDRNVKVSPKAVAERLNTMPRKIEACEYFSLSEIASFLNWKTESINRELMMSLKKYSNTSCHHFTPDSENFTLRVNWKSEKAQQNKVLENQYKTYLSKGEKGLSYKVSTPDKGSASLFGTGPDRDAKIIYILRTRFEEVAEVIIEGSFYKNDPAAFEAIFTNILKQLK